MPKSSSKQRLVLLDAHAIIHRAYHALPDFATASGEPTGALYGVSTMLIKIIEDLHPDYIIACFDLPEKTHRHEAYEEYKGRRKKLDPNLIAQLERSKDLFTAWGVPMYSMPGFEADDILGTIVEEEKKNKDLEIVIASGDMDTLQLVDGKRVQVYTLKKGINDTILYDEARVEERFGFAPLLLPDFKGLRGDPSDNIIGVKGIGEKTATTLVTTFGTVEKIYKALKADKGDWKKLGITPRIKELLLNNEEEALFSKTLATIRRDAPIDFKLPAPWKENLNLDTLLEMFKVLEFRTMGERVRLLLFSDSTRYASPNSKAKRALSEKSTDTASVRKALKSGSAARTDVVEEAQKEKKEQTPEEKELCVMLWVIDSNVSYPTIDDVYTFTKTKTVEEARVVLEAELDKRNVRSVYEDIEKPVTPVIEKMNARGVKIDTKELGRLSHEYHAELSKLEKAIWADAGEEFNINSPKQLGEILFVKLELGEKRQKKTATGSFSTKESELEKLKDKHPIIERILQYRELQKLLSTYIDAIPPQLDAHARLHSTFVQAGTTTGRMASLDPNLQNIPTKSPLGQAIRYAFIADEGYCLLSLDYSQIELRIAAILSKDEKLMEIFRRGEDVHTGVAAEVFKVKPGEVTKDMRRRAKIINFGILYGMGVNALKANLGTDRKEAQEFYNRYFETFTTLAQYLDGVKADAERRGYTETMFGRRRYFAGFRSPLPFIRAQAERMAINAPIQGTEADIVKISMARIDQKILEKGWQDKVFTVLNVHDEIVYEVEDGLAETARDEFKKIMESVMTPEQTLGVPIVAEAAIGKSWGALK